MPPRHAPSCPDLLCSPHLTPLRAPPALPHTCGWLLTPGCGGDPETSTRVRAWEPGRGYQGWEGTLPRRAGAEGVRPVPWRGRPLRDRGGLSPPRGLHVAAVGDPKTSGARTSRLAARPQGLPLLLSALWASASSWLIYQHPPPPFSKTGFQNASQHFSSLSRVPEDEPRPGSLAQMP